MELDGPSPAPRRIRGDHPLGMASLEVQQAAGASHALERHVHDAGGAFVSDADRLARDRGIPASGGFLDRLEAQRSVDDAVEREAARIREWQPGATVKTPFITEVALDRVTGHSLTREEFDAGRRESLPTTGVRVVMMPDERFASGFAVLTAYNVRVPAPAAVALEIEPLRLYAAAGYRDLTADPIEARPAGHRISDRWTSPERTQEALAAGVRHWSSEIDVWLRDPAAPERFTRAYCHDRTVGTTIKAGEWADGDREGVATPLLNFTLQKDARFASGFAVAAAFPSRGF